MKKILFAVAIVTFACAFVSYDADSVDDGSLSTMNADDTGGPGGSGRTIPPPPKDPNASTGRNSSIGR